MNKYHKFITRGFLVFAFFFSYLGCRQVVNEELTRTNIYFDLKGLLSHQILLLDSLQPEINKLTLIDGVRETQIIQLDSAGWVREMEIFFEADINEPILRGAYKLNEKKLSDSLRVLSYEAVDKGNVKIERLNVFYNKDIDDPTAITAVFTEKNALYNSKRSLRLSFNYNKNLHILSGYSIEGNQKMLLKDTIFYKVEVENKL